MNRPNITIEKYDVMEEGDIVDEGMEATIIFTNGMFSKCEYNLNGSYSFKAWMFLGKVAEKIREINNDHCNGGG